MKEILDKLRSSLIPLYGKGETEAIIRIIFHYLKGWSLTDILIHQEDPLSDYIKGQLDLILERLLKYEPIQYITGEARFHGMDLNVKPGVLIPRPETDELVDIIIDENKGRDDLKVLDLCTGSGCIAIALARNLPFSKVDAIDFSSDAIETAEENVKKLKVKVSLFKKDIFNWEPTQDYDIIVSNPPYIMNKEAIHMEKNVLEYEPWEALFVKDENPLEYYERIADIALKALNPKGKLYLEINPLTSDELRKHLISKGFRDVIVIKDSFGKNRFITASLNG